MPRKPNDEDQDWVVPVAATYIGTGIVRAKTMKEAQRVASSGGYVSIKLDPKITSLTRRGHPCRTTSADGPSDLDALVQIG